jgi:hypothetical protein
MTARMNYFFSYIIKSKQNISSFESRSRCLKHCTPRTPPLRQQAELVAAAATGSCPFSFDVVLLSSPSSINETGWNNPTPQIGRHCFSTSAVTTPAGRAVHCRSRRQFRRPVGIDDDRHRRRMQGFFASPCRRRRHHHRRRSGRRRWIGDVVVVLVPKQFHLPRISIGVGIFCRVNEVFCFVLFDYGTLKQ